MNNKFFVLALSIIYSTTLYAGEKSVTCSLTSLKNKKIEATIPLTSENGNSVDSDGGLNIGKENYSFSMNVYDTKTNGEFELSVFFYENNISADEVGGLSCKFKKTAGVKEICREPMYSSRGKLFGQFICHSI